MKNIYIFSAPGNRKIGALIFLKILQERANIVRL